MTWAGILGKQADPDGRQVFRSPIATLIWWIWVLFAVAVFIDATVVRMVVGPALLQLAGDWNWWPLGLYGAPATSEKELIP